MSYKRDTGDVPHSSGLFPSAWELTSGGTWTHCKYNYNEIILNIEREKGIEKNISLTPTS